MGGVIADPAGGGRIRTGQNWIGGNDHNPCGAAFAPPPICVHRKQTVHRIYNSHPAEGLGFEPPRRPNSSPRACPCSLGVT